MSKRIPIFYACDDNFVKFTIVSIQSLKANASRDFGYDIHILCTKVSDEMRKAALSLADVAEILMGMMMPEIMRLRTFN